MSDENKVFERALELIAEGKVKIVERTDELIWGTVFSSSGEPYTPFVTKGGGGTCGCAIQALKGGLCKHVAAMLLQVPHYDLIAWVSKGE